MGRLISGLLDNDSLFGKVMYKALVIIGTSLLFALFSLPFITAGPALAALYYVMLELFHRSGTVRIFKDFWRGFRMNLKQGLLSAVLFALCAGILAADIRFCAGQGGILGLFRYACFALLTVLVITAVHLMPVMAAFSDTLPHLVRNALFFAFRHPLRMIAVTALHVIPVLVTVLDSYMRPLYGFLWVTFLPGAIAMASSRMLIGDFEVFLPGQKDPAEDTDQETSRQEKSERQILREMKKLDRS